MTLITSTLCRAHPALQKERKQPAAAGWRKRGKRRKGEPTERRTTQREREKRERHALHARTAVVGRTVGEPVGRRGPLVAQVQTAIHPGQEQTSASIGQYKYVGSHRRAIKHGMRRGGESIGRGGLVVPYHATVMEASIKVVELATVAWCSPLD